MIRSRSTIFAAAVIVAGALASVAIASPNDGRFKRSAEGMKKQQLEIACAQIKSDLDTAEYWADKYAGTKDAKVHAENADALWAAGEKAGCGWAQ